MSQRAVPVLTKPATGSLPGLYLVPVTLADALPPPPPSVPKPRRRAAALAGVVGIAAIAGGGAWAWHAWTAQGPQASEALPASTLAYVGLDLDPPGGQKVGAWNALRKFPALEDGLHLGSRDDLRESLVASVADESDCDLDVDAVKKWAGQRAAVAVVPVKGPELVVVLQVADADKARTGLERISDECGGEDFGFDLAGDWAVIAQSTEIAEQVSSDAEGATLAESDDFQELVGATGDPGVLTVYAAPAAGKALLDLNENADFPFLGFLGYLPVASFEPVTTVITWVTMLHSLDSWIEEDEASDAFAGEDEGEGILAGEDPDAGFTPEQKRLMEKMEDYPDLSPSEQAELDEEMSKAFGWDDMGEDEFDEGDFSIEVPATLRKDLEDFSGLGATVRFEDGGLEAEIVSDPFLTGTAEVYDGEDAYDAVAALPADTALAFGGGFRDGWAKKAIERSQLSLFGADDPAKAFKEVTGLSAADLEALGGESIAIAGGPDFSRAIDSEKPADVPVAVRVTGDAGAIEKALAKLRASGDLKDFVLSERTDDGVVIGPNPSYLRHVADPGKTLGDVDRFSDALGDAQDAVVLTYADADAGDWLVQLSEGDLSKKDVEPLGTFSLVGSREGDRERQVLRISLD